MSYVSASRLLEPDRLSAEPKPAILSSLQPFFPALHYALFKLRQNHGKDLSTGVERQAQDYLIRMDTGTVRQFILPDYRHNMDDRINLPPPTRPKYNMDAMLRSYFHNPTTYVFPLTKAKDIIERIRKPIPTPAPAPVEYSPVSDWGGSDRGSDRSERPPERLPPEKPSHERVQEKPPPESSRRKAGLAHSNGAQVQQKSQPQSQKLRLSQNEYDKDKMKQLLKLIQLHKKALVKDPGKEKGEVGEDGAWDSNNLKRKFEGDDRGGVNKHQRTDPLSNGEPSRGEEGCSFSDVSCLRIYAQCQFWKFCFLRNLSTFNIRYVIQFKGQ